MATIDLKDVTMTIKDGGSNSVEMKIGEGTLTYTEARNMEYMLERGALDTVREGDEIPMDVSFDLKWEFLKSSTSSTPTVEEALKKTGAAADWTSTSADLCEPYAVDIEIDHDPSCSTEEDETITLPDFRWESLAHDIKAGTISCSGKCNATKATIIRAASAATT